MTKADEGAAPTARGVVDIGTPASSGSSVGVAELTHEQVRAQLSEYLDDTLGDVARRRIDGHLAACPPCSAYLETLRLTVRALGQLPAPRAPRDARARILDQAQRERG